MLGRDIEIINPRKRRVSSGQRIFYPNELTYNGLTRKIKVSPPPELRIGMDKIQKRGWFMRYLVDYANRALFHGLNHLVAPDRHLSERIGTMMILIGSMILLFFLSLSFWRDYQENALTTVVNHDYRNYNIVFPAIVVCPFPGVDATKFPSVLEKYGINDTEEVRNFFTVASQLPYLQLPRLPELNINPNDVMHILYDLKLNIINSTRTQGTWIITPRGICIEFLNSASQFSTIGQWTNGTIRDDDTPDDSNEIHYCRYIDQSCSYALFINENATYWLAITASGDIAPYDTFRLLPPGIDIDLQAYSQIIITSENARGLGEDRRHCKYSSEGGLVTWPIYTKRMCVMECAALKLLRKCNCTFHFLKPMPGWPVCNLSESRHQGVLSGKGVKRFFSSEIDCSCPEDCHSTTYSLDAPIFKHIREFNRQTTIIITVIFPKSIYYRVLDFTFLDFLAALGGGAGLLLGASTLSFVEFIYFFTLRLYWQYIRIKCEKKRKLRVIRPIIIKKANNQ